MHITVGLYPHVFKLKSTWTQKLSQALRGSCSGLEASVSFVNQSLVEAKKTVLREQSWGDC